MIPQSQQEALSVLAEVLALSPDIRLGQLFAHLGFLGEVHLERGLGYIDDDEFLSILYRHRAELLARSQDSSKQTQPVSAAVGQNGGNLPLANTSISR